MYNLLCQNRCKWAWMLQRSIKPPGGSCQCVHCIITDYHLYYYFFKTTGITLYPIDFLKAPERHRRLVFCGESTKRCGNSANIPYLKVLYIVLCNSYYVCASRAYEGYDVHEGVRIREREYTREARQKTCILSRFKGFTYL